MPRKTLRERFTTTLKGMRQRAKKDGQTVSFTVDDLVAIAPEICPWCRQRLAPSRINVDHLIPVSRGGSWELGNMQVVCKTCNLRKGALTFAEYRLLLRKLRELTDELEGDPFVAKNVLKRLSAGGAWIYGR